MKEFAAALNHAGWWNLLFFGLALLSIALAVCFYFKALRIRIPVFNQKSSQLVGTRLAQLDSLAIIYNGEPVRTLCITTVAFWNRGRQYIEPGDFAPRDPFRISVAEGANLLDARLVAANEPRNGITLEVRREESAVVVTFDYLGHNNGAVVEIFHTGTDSSKIKLLGTVKDAGQFRRYRVKDYLLNALIENAFEWIPDLVLLKGPVAFFRNVGCVLLTLAMFALSFPWALVLVPVDTVLRWYRLPPSREFLLE